MPLTLQSFVTGDTNYLNKHNANVAALVSFLNSLETTLNSVSGGSSGLANAGNIGAATFGTGSGMAFVGSGSFSQTNSAPTMTIQGGFCWDASLALMHYKQAATVLTFAGLPAATYYIRFDGADNPYIDDITSGAIYSVIWNGSTFGTITQLATVTPTAPDIGNMNVSAYSGVTYTTPAQRIAATEKAFSDLLDADIGSGNFTPTTQAFMETIGIRLTGATTANRIVTVPNRDKVILVHNEFTSSNASTVEVKTAAGTGVTLKAGEHAILYCNSTNVVHIFRQGTATPITTFLHLTDTPDSYTGQAMKVLRVKPDETGTELVAASSLGAGTPLTVKDEGVDVDTTVAGINFEGAGVSVVQTAGGQVKVTVPGVATSGLTVKDEGVNVDTAVVLINFVGDGVTVTQTAAGQVLVTIPGLSGSGSADYDIAFFVADKRPAGAVAYRHTFAKAVDFAANFAPSDADALTAAAATAVWTVKKNGATVGTLTFATSGTTGTFATTGGAAVSFLAGDIMEVVAPNPQDATLAGVSITFAGTRA